MLHFYSDRKNNISLSPVCCEVNNSEALGDYKRNLNKQVLDAHWTTARP